MSAGLWSPPADLPAVRMMFDFALCENCGGHYADHKVVEGPSGLPLAACLRELPEGAG